MKNEKNAENYCRGSKGLLITRSAVTALKLDIHLLMENQN